MNETYLTIVERDLRLLKKPLASEFGRRESDELSR